MLRDLAFLPFARQDFFNRDENDRLVMTPRGQALRETFEFEEMRPALSKFLTHEDWDAFERELAVWAEGLPGEAVRNFGDPRRVERGPGEEEEGEGRVRQGGKVREEEKVKSFRKFSDLVMNRAASRGFTRQSRPFQPHGSLDGMPKIFSGMEISTRGLIATPLTWRRESQTQRESEGRGAREREKKVNYGRHRRDDPPLEHCRSPALPRRRRGLLSSCPSTSHSTSI